LYKGNCKLVLSASTLFFCFCKIGKWPIAVTLAMSGSEAVDESYKLSYEDTVSSERAIETHPRAKNGCGPEFSNALAVPGSNQR